MYSRAIRAAALACLVWPVGAALAHAEEWVVAKSTGQVWHATAKAQPVALGAETKLAPGDLVQTGPSGRVMLTRGSERILVAPNSVISLPKTEDKPGFTTILQQAGSIVVEAEKKDHKHFEVLTPYLAAVVKGTQFTVNVHDATAGVSVQSGKVEVADTKTGKIALVLPGQFAQVNPTAGLTLGGQGTFEPIVQGQPRAAVPTPIQVPKQGLQAPPRVERGLRVDAVKATVTPGSNVVRIEKALGPIALDAGTSTNGLVRSEGVRTSTPTIWKAADPTVASSNSSSSSSNSSSNSSNGPGAAPAATAATPGVPSGVGVGVGAGGVSASVSASNNGAGVAGVNAGNAFGLNGGNGVGKAWGLIKKNH